MSLSYKRLRCSHMRRGITPFDEAKYSIWKYRKKCLMRELRVLKVIEEPTPEQPDKKWARAEDTAHNVITEHLADSHLGYAQRGNTAEQILQALDQVFERKSKLQGETQLINHFATFDDLVSELIAAGDEMTEAQKIMRLLLLLPPSYDSINTAIETISEDLTTLDYVKTKLLVHEVKLTQQNCDTSTKVPSAINENNYSQMSQNNHFVRNGLNGYQFN